MLLTKDLARELQVKVINVVDRVPVKRRGALRSAQASKCVSCFNPRLGLIVCMLRGRLRLTRACFCYGSFVTKATHQNPDFISSVVIFSLAWTRSVYIDYTFMDTSWHVLLFSQQ